MHNDPLNIANLINWLETKPADEEYDYGSIHECLFAQFFTHCGCTDVVCGSLSIDYNGLKEVRLPNVYNRIAVGRPSTFGAALERAKSLA